MGLSLTSRGLLLQVGVFSVALVAADGAVLAWDGRDRLVTGVPVTWSEGAVEVPTDGFDAWASRRESVGVPVDRALHESALGVADLAETVEVLVDEGHLGWEIAWLAAGAAAGAWPDAAAADWIDVLADVQASGALSSALRQRLARLSFSARGSAMAAVAPSCLPESAADLAAVDAIVAFELAVPSTRVGASDEVTGALPIALTPAAELARAVVTLTTMREVESADLEPGCGGGVARLLAGASRWSASDASMHLDALRFAASSGPVPERVVRRIAVHAYLATDVARLEALIAVEMQQGRATGPTAARVDALAAGAGQDISEMVRRAAALTGDDALARWIRAESARLDGDHDEAIRLADGVIDEDPGFVGAILTRASAHLNRGTAELALADLVYLRQRWSDEPLYSPWIDRLAAALDARQF